MSSLPDAEYSAADADAGLLRRLASGDREALDALYRRHEDYARRVAIAVSGGDKGVADDLMAEAFAAVFRRATSNTPILNFRAYLGACIRNAHIAHRREGARLLPASDQPWLFDSADDDPHLVDGLAAEHAVAALAALPVGWRELLWRIEVEGLSNSELAALMGKSHSAISSMSHRARAALRREFLDRHVPTAEESACRWARQRLSRYVRGELSDRPADRVRSHVAECTTCTEVLRDLESVNRRIGVSVWPVLVVGAGAGPTPTMLPDADGSQPSTPSGPASSPMAALTGASPAVVGTVVATVAAVVVAAGAFAMNLIGSDDAGPSDNPHSAVAPGAASGLEDPQAQADEPPAGLAGGPEAGLPLAAADERSDKRESDDEEEEEQDESSKSPSSPTATPTRPPTYDASIAGVDKSAVSNELTQSLTFDVQMTSVSRRTGLVLSLAITISEQQFSVEQFSGSGWTCRIEPNGEDLKDHLGGQFVFDPGTEFTCIYEFPDEDAPPPLDFDLELPSADGVTGLVRVSVVEQNDPTPGNDTATF